LRILERLWKPNPKDIAAGQILQTRYYQLVSVAGALASLTFNSPVVPPNVMRVIQQIGGVVQSGAAQTVLGLDFNGLSNGVQFAVISAEPFFLKAAAASWRFGLSLGEGIAFRPGDTFQLSTFFNAGAASNSMGILVYGYDIPVGNTQ
jgi:hypothetical protein